MAYINGKEVLFSATINSSGTVKRAKLENTTEPLIVEDNTIYIADASITNLDIDLPNEAHICSLIFEVGENYEIEFNYDAGEIRYINGAPDFQAGETWELSIHNGIIASGKVVSE